MRVELLLFFVLMFSCLSTFRVCVNNFQYLFVFCLKHIKHFLLPNYSISNPKKLAAIWILHFLFKRPNLAREKIASQTSNCRYRPRLNGHNFFALSFCSSAIVQVSFCQIYFKTIFTRRHNSCDSLYICFSKFQSHCQICNQSSRTFRPILLTSQY